MKRYKQLLLGVLLFVMLIFFLQTTNAFHFYYIEQFQLFLFSWEYIVDQLAYPGGLALSIGEFCVQFFVQPYVGAIITATLLALVGLLTHRLLKRITAMELFAFYLLPPLALLLIHFNFNYLYQGTIAYILFLLFLNGYVRISNFYYRLPIGLFAIPLLFWAAGPIAGLFTLCLILWEILQRTSRGYLSLLFAITYLVLVYICYQQAIVRDYSFAFLPDAYFHPTITPPTVIYYSWICLPLIIGAAFLSRKYDLKSDKTKLFSFIAQLVVVAGLCFWLIPQYEDKESKTLKELDYYAHQQDWDKIISISNGSMNNYLYLGYLNMALAEKKELGDRMFFFDQHGMEGLVRTWDRTIVTSNLLSHVYFTLGEVALAQQMAFEANEIVVGFGNPHNLKRLIQTNLIYGEYLVAEKYIRLLEQTFGYRDWAKEHRRFLNNDTAVEADPLFGSKRKMLPAKTTLTGLESVPSLLQSRVDEGLYDNQFSNS
ncbi:DUF6057 family protein [Parabacteroides sp. PF5-9]|uniref:DUF6057 family protein n=1 Tax=Parabacteroides sp. PF5-9 TaxID=1742404 RepID=UPI002476CC70|nr:DUF6057 family protein [Parabacteroides sp. PF5-9]MDH6356765.1 tetratricopeptide (TPR) repeat protein [Parabacteroides sp. PF5-9]